MIDQEVQLLKSNPATLRLFASRVPLEKQGKDYFGRCPFHTEKSGSFSVSLKNGEWLFHCFGCSEGGDIFKFIQKLDNCSFKDAIKIVKDFVGDTSNVDRVFKPIEVIPKAYKTFTQAQYEKLEDSLARSEAGKKWLQEERGISYDTAKQYHLGFRQDLKDIAGVKNTDIAGQGWISFPAIRDGVVVSIKYRSIVRKAFCRQPGMQTVVCGLDEVNVMEPVWLCEGEPDKLILNQAGFCAVSLPSAGHVLSPAERDIILQSEYVVLAGDNDAGAGVKAMDRLAVDFSNRATRVEWPNSCKDANETFLKECKGDVGAFRKLCREVISKSKSEPMKGVYSLQEVMRRSEQGVLADHPNRLHFPWPSVDKMANVLPGDVVAVTATTTGIGKTQWVMNVTLFGARRFNEVVLNYQVELSPEEFANMSAAHILGQDRNKIGHPQYMKAADVLSNIKYYVGADPSLNTATPVLDLIEEAVKRFGATIVVIDHIHFICRNSNNEIQEQSNAMQRIKNMARQYGLKFIVVGQPRKADQKSRGRELDLADMKGSESITSDSSVAYFIHREVVKNIDPSNPPLDDHEPETEIRLKKARSKGTGKAYAKLYFHGNIATFHEMTPEHEEFPLDNFR